MRLDDGYYEDAVPFSIKNGFMIAAAITGDFKPLYSIPPSIGALKFYSKSWNQEEYLGFRELEWEFCPPEYF